MGRWLFLSLLLCATLAAQEAPIPTATELPGRPFAIQKKWIIGGTGNWDYLTLDPVARQLFVTHQTQVQVVDIDSGAVIGTVLGFDEAHAVVLDPDGDAGYVSDGRANAVRVFNRRTFEVEAAIDAGCPPRSMTFEPQTQLLFAICGGVASTQPNAPRAQHRSVPSEQNPPASPGISHLVVIEPKARLVLAIVAVPADLRNARADGAGLVFVTAGAMALIDARTHARNVIGPGVVRIDAVAIAAEARRRLQASGQKEMARRNPAQWDEDPNGGGGRVRMMRLDEECGNPQGIDVATRPLRLFVGCSDQKLEILNGDTGAALAALTIGPGTDAVVYDPNRSLIFTANGDGYGSVTIVRRHVTDTYNVIQNLPTLQRARTMAVDPSTGDVYVVTTLYGAKLSNPPFNGIGTLKLDPVDGSFQVLVIGN